MAVEEMTVEEQAVEEQAVEQQDDAVLDQFFGDDQFPIEWESDQEKQLFWVFDDLHCPHPLSPMFYEIGGWWLTCDHMFRRFGTPFAADWITKNVNGYLYTAAVPADPKWTVDAMEYGSRYGARVPLDPQYSERIGKYLDATLPVYGERFAIWWHHRLVPEMQRNFTFLEEVLDRQDALTLPELAVLLEDAIDVHDRHWKIHWMLNFAQLSATLKLRAVMEKTHGRVDDALLGRLQNSASDRNWDSIKALWEMKEEAKADPELAKAFSHETAGEILAALERSEPGQRFVSERIKPYQKEFGWHAVWSHEFIFPTVYEKIEPVIELVRGYIETNYDYPTTMGALKADIEAASREILEGLDGEALEEMRAANKVNLWMAPLTPDHHFYIDQGANAHVRLVLVAIGKKLVAHRGARRCRGRDVPALQRAARAHRRSRGVRSALEDRRAQSRPRTVIREATAGLDRHGHGEPAGVPVSRQLGLPREVLSQGRADRGPVQGHRRFAGRGRRHRARGLARGPVRRSARRRHPRLPHDQSGMGRAVHEDRRPGQQRRRADRSSGSAEPRVRHPGRRRNAGRDAADQHRRSHPRRRHDRDGRHPRSGCPASQRSLHQPA